MRRSARLLRIHRITVSRKLKFLAEQARLSHSDFLKKYYEQKVTKVQFDELETFEHTKLKPLSVALAVTKDRYILDFQVSSMPAKGVLSSKSLEKYGPRRDDRRKGLNALLNTLEKVVDARAIFESDQNPRYPLILKSKFPNATHLTTPGQRGCIVGQGELKKIPWDPLFSFNHTAAMFRANVNRLFRKTWCTTKRPISLSHHLALYVQYHNRVLVA